MTLVSKQEYRKLLAAGRPKRANKYGAKKDYRCLSCGAAAVSADKKTCRACHGTNIQKFDSKAEASHYDTLRTMRRMGEIRDLECQPRFPILVNGQNVGSYVADFRYLDAGGSVVVVDVKGGDATDTALSRFKRKCVTAQHGIDIRIIRT